MLKRKQLLVWGISILFFTNSILGCRNSESVTYSETSQNLISNVDQNVNDSLLFYQVKKYIQNNGKHERVSVSSIANDTSLMVDYYSILNNDWEITIDHSNRIYFSRDKIHYGNVILQGDSVFVEPYHLGPKENIDTVNQIIKPINEVYKTLLKSTFDY